MKKVCPHLHFYFDRLVDGGWIDGLMDGWIDGRMDGLMDKI